MEYSRVMGLTGLLIIILIILNCVPAGAADTGRQKKPESGLHLSAGFGINSIHYKSDDDDSDPNPGINLKADVHWLFDRRWAFEASSSIKFNEVEDFRIWDTLITMGVRVNITGIDLMKEISYGRVFVGYSPTVVYVGDGAKDEFGDFPRIHYSGYAYGLGFGKTYRTKNGHYWYIEMDVSNQRLKLKESVVMDGITPIIVERVTIKDNSRLYSIYITVGWILF